MVRLVNINKLKQSFSEVFVTTLADLRPEPKNFKTFFVHTVSLNLFAQCCQLYNIWYPLQPNRTYFLEDVSGNAPVWCQLIDEVRKATYGNSQADTIEESRSNNSESAGCSRKISVGSKKAR